MPAEVVSSRVVPKAGCEEVRIMDDYGTDFRLNVLVSDSANRQTRIDAALAQQQSNQDKLTAYAAAHNIDMTAELAAGTAAKAAAKGNA